MPLCGPAVRYSSSRLFWIQWNANCVSTKLSCFTHNIFVLFANVWHAECSCETCLLCVSINKTPSQMIIIYVCLCVCLIIHGPLFFFFSCHMVSVKFKWYPWKHFSTVNFKLWSLAQYHKVLLTEISTEPNFSAKGVPETTCGLCMSCIWGEGSICSHTVMLPARVPALNTARQSPWENARRFWFIVPARMLLHLRPQLVTRQL